MIHNVDNLILQLALFFLSFSHRIGYKTGLGGGHIILQLA